MRKLTRNLSSYKDFPGLFQEFKALALRVLYDQNVNTTENHHKKDLQLASNVIRNQNASGCQEQTLAQSNSSKGLQNSKPQFVERPSPYRKQSKRNNLTTKSDILIFALGDIGREYAKPQRFRSKIDLSWANRIKLASGSRPLKAKFEARIADCRSVLDDTSLYVESLQHLLALYIKNVSSNVEDSRQWEQVPAAEDNLDRGLLHIFHKRNLELLNRNGYDVEDLSTWTWILAADTADKAAMRLTAYSNHVRRNFRVGKPLPTFLYLFLLRRQNFSSRALRLLILYGWDRLLFQPKFETKSDPVDGTTQTTLYPKLTEHCLIIMFVRLVRRAREVWPVALISITSMITRYLNGMDTAISVRKKLANETTARITGVYNVALSLLAETSSSGPFQSVRYQQQAQFQVIRKMNEFQPALTINREGYRAMVRVQLAHKKTDSERQWAKMKAKSWPPWKEEKSGLDSNVGIENGRSRAGEILLRSKEAGYAPQDWEKIAGVFAGWDTDHSPTIQTRTQLRVPKKSRSLFDPGDDAIDFEINSSLWAARIQCTRTLDEAWACFLSYKRSGAQSIQAIYFSLFEKIIFHENPKKSRNRASRLNSEKFFGKTIEEPLPGDGKETWPNPGPSETVYVRTPALNRFQFSELMMDDKIRPSGRFLSSLLRNTKWFAEGMRYLSMSPLSQEVTQALLNEDESKDDCFSSTLKTVDLDLYTSFIRFLVQSALSSSESKRRILDTTSPPQWPTSIRQAFRLVELRKPLYLPPWYSLFQALVNPRLTIHTGDSSSDSSLQPASKWGVMSNLLVKMEEKNLQIDFEGFRLLCVGLEKALVANQRLLYTSNKATDSVDVDDLVHCHKEHSEYQPIDLIKSRPDATLSGGLSLLKYHFKRLVGPSSSTEDPYRRYELYGTTHESIVVEAYFDPVTMLPRVHKLFHTSHLHSFIRALGVGCDYYGILELLKWMDQYVPELNSIIDDSSNSSRLARRCIVAVGAFMERGSFYIYNQYEGQRDAGASPETLEATFNIIEKHKDWGGWPTEEEIDHYCCNYCSQNVLR